MNEQWGWYRIICELQRDQALGFTLKEVGAQRFEDCLIHLSYLADYASIERMKSDGR